MNTIGILGAGTWGLALARMLALHGRDVTVWSALEEEIDRYSQTRFHPYLNMEIPSSIVFTKKIEEVCQNKDILLFAVPSPFVRNSAALARPYIPNGQIVVDVAKGIEAESLFTLTEVIREEVTRDGEHNDIKLVALSGPTHAEEVASGMPTTIVSSCREHDIAVKVQKFFSCDVLRVYTSTDVLGVELCGALKNIIALAAGIAVGLGYGDNTKAALITRGMAEISRLGAAMGCSDKTFYGLAGIGDLIVTATSEHSRNNRAGFLIGSGKKPEEAVREVGMVVEGIHALPAALALSAQYDVEMPIVFAVDAIVNHAADAREIVMNLMRFGRKAFSKQ